MLLTDIQIRTKKPTKDTVRLKDGEGLFLSVKPNGNKYWQLRYFYLDKEKTLSLGKYPTVSLAEARDKKIEAKRLLDQGKDPSLARKQEKLKSVRRDRNTFGAIAEEWFEQQAELWSLRYKKNMRSRLDLHILPSLKRRPITEIEAAELLVVIQEIDRAGTPYMARRCLQICSLIINYATFSGRATYNVAIGLERALRPYRASHHPTIGEEELREFLNAFHQLDTSEQNKIAFKLLLLSALRTGEMRFSKWSDIYWERKEWRVRAEITKMRREHIVPLSRQMINLLERLHELTGHQEWLLPNPQRRSNPVISENLINHLIGRMGFKGRIVGHGFRALFSTVLNEREFNRDAIERQLAHVEKNSVRAAYNRAEHLEKRRELMQWWADFIETNESAGRSPFREVYCA